MEMTLYTSFLSTLKTRGFSGDICDDLASRSVMSTDNSVYQVFPAAVLYPRTHDDVVKVFQLASEATFKPIVFAARGGGTGPNGQSLTSGIVINFRRYMRRILKLDLEKQIVEVEPGVVLDELNDFLRPHGCFFAPTVSPSNRATLGGMVSTDASGQGSCLYGKTSQHIHALKGVLSSGETCITEKISLNEMHLSSHATMLQKIQACVGDKQTAIAQAFPTLLRYMSGYDLVHVLDNGYIDLSRLVAGSEGTLMTLTALQLKITPLPVAKVVFVLSYPSFEAALATSDWINATLPAAVEVIDETVMRLGAQDSIFSDLKALIQPEGKILPGAINLVEYHAENKEKLLNKITSLEEEFKKQQSLNPFYFTVTQEPNLIKKLWMLRKRSVEYLGKLPEVRKPVSGIEDTVVPPSRLKAYIQDLKKILDSHGLQYGMFGHIDAGCIHVRPALDLTNPHDEALYFSVSHEVAKLVKSYGGLIWGEHGKGFRSAYLYDYFSADIINLFREIKTIFDPCNQLNPGKIAAPLGCEQPIFSVEMPPLRAHAIRKTNFCDKTNYASSLSCNGNAACLDYALNAVMCPSYKVTQDPVHSPKGRASIINEWLYLRDTKDASYLNAEKSAYLALEGCLGCKACVTACPVAVNIPAVKAQFYEAYFKKRLRSISQMMLAYSERLNLFFLRFPHLMNRCLQHVVIKKLLKYLGLVDLPAFTHLSFPLQKALKKNSEFNYITRKNLDAQIYPNNSVCLLVDWLLRCYDPALVFQIADWLRTLGYTVYFCLDAENGKGFHAQGMLRSFHKIVEKTTNYLNAISLKGLPIIGIEPSLTLVYRDEYLHILKKSGLSLAKVFFLQEFLDSRSPQLVSSSYGGEVMKEEVAPTTEKKTYYLFSHCSEKSCLEGSERLWEKLFTSVGLKLIIVPTGCCGMAGSYGHEVKHVENSKRLFEMGWISAIQDKAIPLENMLVTGFSCREQVKRMLGLKVKHPAEILNARGIN